MYVSIYSWLHCIRNELCIPFRFLVSSAARHFSNTFSPYVILFLLHASTKNCTIIIELCYRYVSWQRVNKTFFLAQCSAAWQCTCRSTKRSPKKPKLAQLRWKSRLLPEIQSLLRSSHDPVTGPWRGPTEHSPPTQNGFKTHFKIIL